MDLANEINQLTQQFQTVTLDEIKPLRLMKRIDKKYVFDVSSLPSLLEAASPNYNLLKIEDSREQAYLTVYFDTNEHNLYLDHHRGKLNRYKVRIRKYLSSGDLFLEIKHKNNKRQTLKSRTDQPDNFQISPSQSQFIKELTGVSASQLAPMVYVEFKRITLINMERKERVTLDYDLSFRNFQNEDQCHRLENIAIAEVKRNAFDNKSSFNKLLKEKRIYENGFSKYCMAMVLINDKVKKNRFKQRLRLLHKIENKVVTVI